MYMGLYKGLSGVRRVRFYKGFIECSDLEEFCQVSKGRHSSSSSSSSSSSTCCAATCAVIVDVVVCC